MNVEFKAQHGEAVFKYFEDIRERAPGPFVVDDLQIERIDVKASSFKHQSSTDKLKVSVSSTSDKMQAASLPINSLEKPESEMSVAFGGVKVTALLRSFQIEM